MNTVYQLVLLRRYGKKTILFEAKTFFEVKTGGEKHAEKYVEKRVSIQQSTIIKNKA